MGPLSFLHPKVALFDCNLHKFAPPPLSLTLVGVPSEGTVISTYFQGGRAASDADFSTFLGLSFLRLASITQGVYARSLQGNASGANAGDLQALVVLLAEDGLACAMLPPPSPNPTLALSPKAAATKARLVKFMEECVYPSEATWAEQLKTLPRWGAIPPVLEELKAEAKRRNLFNLFLPHESGLTQAEYAQLAEITGRSLLAAEVR